MGPLTYKVFNLYTFIRCGTYNSHLYITTLEVEHLISKRTHKPIALRFWVRVWRLSCLYGCSSLDVGGPPGSPHDPTVIPELSGYVPSAVLN